ncbi:hypothetical protein TSUD_176420 [Trifolium subterraneum]|uniref:Bulb-type lectin domain-containing protein n=1 Tax=Trifolium subterraneum TaxID=3900 RepID=A0A2Z6MY77_TRISU|nr:hypothetical protein TSUD_176420 [Trifolium subterraneum]
MDLSFTLFLLIFPFLFQCSSSSSSSSLRKGSSLSVEDPEDRIISPNGIFTAGFTAIGENAYSFAIWFTEQNSFNSTIVWMANRDQPVNGKRSKLTLLNTGNIVLFDVSLSNVWSSNTASLEPIELHLKDDGNLVLREVQGTNILWQSFDSPTDTLLPGQPLTRYTELVASRSETNHSTGFYRFSFDDSNVLVLRYDGPDISSSYWPKPWLLISQTGRASFNGSRIAILDNFGNFLSSDNLTFITSDSGTILQRRMKMDPDGYRVKNHSDWSYGCEPMFDFTCNRSESTFLAMVKGFYKCFTKTQLRNGRHSPFFVGTTYLRLPKGNNFSKQETSTPGDHVCQVKLQRVFVSARPSKIIMQTTRATI